MIIDRRTVILGPTNCGKSEYAETLVEGLGEKFLYIATLVDCEFNKARILRHKSRRGSEWDVKVLEPGYDDSIQSIRSAFHAGLPVLLDGISIFIARFSDELELDLPITMNSLMSSFTMELKTIVTETPSPWVIVDYEPLSQSEERSSEFYEFMRAFYLDLTQISNAVCIRF